MAKATKGDDELLKLVRKRFTEGVDYDRRNRDAGLEDLKFMTGEQWDESVEAARLKAGRPCLKINTLPTFVAQVAGDVRINRPAIRVRPAEDADKDLASVREGLIRAIERDSDAQAVYARAATDQIACGIGNFRIGLEYADDSGFDRDIRIRSIPNPFAVVWDPAISDPTGRDARWCFVEEIMPKEEFEAAYPDAMGSLTAELKVPLEAENWMTRETVRVVEYWEVKERPLKLSLLESGAVVEGDQIPEGEAIVQERQGRRRTVCMYLMTGHTILEGPVEFPISRIPIFRVPGWEVLVGDDRRRWGLIRFAKDPARMKNYQRSVAVESMGLAPRAVWLAQARSVDGLEDDFRNANKSGDPLLIYNNNTEPPERIAPPPFPAALMQDAALHAQDIKDVTGLHDASLGAKSNETSGKAIMARQREGDVATYIYHDNLRAAIRECGRVANELIPIVYDTARTVRVLGEDETQKVQRVNDPNDPASVDMSRGRYDIVIETGPSYSTKRVEAAESMMQFVQAVPGAAQIAGDLIAKSQDWPMADAIADRLRKALPPNLASEENDEKTPEQMQQMQAAAQQQQQAQAMQMADAQAEIRKKTADAAKAEAEAGKAQLELSQMSGQLQVVVQAQVANILQGLGVIPPQQAPGPDMASQGMTAQGQGFPAP